ncbi:MAG: hypothetical protein JSS81_29925 [Acidobacteria bacterium]|nr:hypothetical protein [Acidobacteriota bacterium]
MVKRKNNRIADELDKLNDNETTAVLDYISEILQTRKPKSHEPVNPDELIRSLSDAYENKRARQVFEWERVRRQNVPRTI